MVCVVRQTRNFVRAQHACDFCRCTDQQGAVGKLFTFGDQCAGANDTVRPDFRVIQDDGAHADQAVVADGAAMQGDAVANGDIFADVQWRTGIGV